MKKSVLPVTLACWLCAPCSEADEMSVKLLSHGTSIIRLAVTVANSPNPASDDKYANLANKLRYEILSARALGDVASSNADLVATALTAYAATSPEPITKIVAAAGAMAAHKQGEYVAGLVVERTAAQSVKVLRKFLDDQQVSPEKLAGMNATEFVAFSKTLRSGNQTLSEALSDIPGAEKAIEAAAKDFLANKDAALFLKLDVVNESVSALKDGMRANGEVIEKLQEMAKATNDSLRGLRNETSALRGEVSDLRTEVASNTASVRGLIEVSSMSWSPEQKLSALEGGLFKEIAGAEKDKLIKSLKTEIRRDKLVSELSMRGRQLSQLSTIAAGLGAPPGIIDAMAKGQQLASTAVAFVSGDYLAAASSVVAMFGGPKDADAERNAQMMEFLSEQFREVNVKLDEIKKLQEETLQQTIALRNDVLELRKAMDAGFKRIEDQIYLTQELSRKLIREKWEPCDNLLSELNGYPRIDSVPILKRLLSVQVQDNLIDCYSRNRDAFSHWIDPDRWPASVIDFSVFNATLPTTNHEALAGAKDYARTAYKIFADTRAFVLTSVRHDQLLWELSRFALPAPYAHQSEKLEANRSVAFPSDNCKAGLPYDLPALIRIVCFQYDQATDRPDPARLSSILSATLVGPMAPSTIDMGLLMSDMADLFLKRGPGAASSYSFADAEDIDFLIKGTLTVSATHRLSQEKGIELLRIIDTFSLQWLIQQSLIFGDHTASLAVKTLYDDEEGALIVKDPGPDYPDQERRKRILAALTAMESNAILARNVVILGLRRALRQRHGDLPIVAYRIAWAGLQHPSACLGEGPSADRMSQLLKPIKAKAQYASWSFRRVVEATETVPDGKYPGCQPDNSADGRAGTGPAIQFERFHVRMPNFKQLELGNLEQPASLRQALMYRNKTTQALVARRIPEIAAGSILPQGLLYLYK